MENRDSARCVVECCVSHVFIFLFSTQFRPKISPIVMQKKKKERRKDALNADADDVIFRSFSFVVSSLVLIYHAAAAYLCTYLPSDPLYVSISVTGYAWYGCVLSVLGIAGSIKVGSHTSSLCSYECSRSHQNATLE